MCVHHTWHVHTTRDMYTPHMTCIHHTWHVYTTPHVTCTHHTWHVYTTPHCDMYTPHHIVTCIHHTTRDMYTPTRDMYIPGYAGLTKTVQDISVQTRFMLYPGKAGTEICMVTAVLAYVAVGNRQEGPLLDTKMDGTSLGRGWWQCVGESRPRPEQILWP